MTKGSTVGVIGLGAIGSAFAERLIAKGFSVVGHDVAPQAFEALRALGGTPAASAEEVASRCGTVILSLPSAAAVRQVVASFADAGAGGGCVIDTNTLALADKEAARSELRQAGWALLDCTISGNHDMVLGGDYAFFISGDAEASQQAREVLSALSDRLIPVGAFGAASKIKFIINHLVMIHTAAAAEAMALAHHAGLDPQTVFDLVAGSAGSSRVFEIRAKMMVTDNYTSSRGNYHVIMKDAGVIEGFAQGLDVPVPLFALATQMHMLGVAAGRGEQDTASLGQVLREQVVASRPREPGR